MPLDRFMIAPLNNGLNTYSKPWIIPDNAFAKMQNAYTWRDRVRKRFGSAYTGGNQLLSRARINIGVTQVMAITLPGNASQLQIGQMFSVNNDLFYVNKLGGAAVIYSTNAGATATINNVANPNTVTFTGYAPGIAVYYYPANPITGLTQYEIGAINNHPAYAFDTQFAYAYTPSTGWLLSPGSPTWTGNYQNLFYASNWRGLTEDKTVMFVSNFKFVTGNPALSDPMYSFTNGTWAVFKPVFLGTGAFVTTALIVIPFKNRLLLLNTLENDNSGPGYGAGVETQYKTRCRFSHFGSPFPAASPSVASNAWLEQGEVFMGMFADGGGWVDATTEEAIVSAEFIKDRLIVYFERSTWELVYTQNAVEPFVWQKINTELGSQSTFSTIPFDTAVFTIGNVGIHSCSGSNVQRIDDIIPETVFSFVQENNATKQTCGIRDYDAEMVYWAYQKNDGSQTQTFPNTVLCYNYKNASWSENDDTFTAFGYLEQSTDLIWQNAIFPWSSATYAWNSKLVIADQIQVIAGNQEGFILVIDKDFTQNAGALQITDMSITGQLKIINHNLENGDFIYITGATGNTTYNNGIFGVLVVDANNILISGDSVGVYSGGGVAARVSVIDILTKQFNPYDKSGRNVFVQKIDFLVDATDYGSIAVDYFSSSSELPMNIAGEATGTIMGTGNLSTAPYPVKPFEAEQQRLWHPIYFQTQGECIQMRFYLDDLQIVVPNIAFSDFQLHAMILHTRATNVRLS